MAYTTRKNFYLVPFMNEDNDLECQDTCVKLKSYASTIDDRSWATDDVKQSRFYVELIGCEQQASAQKAGGSAGGPVKSDQHQPSGTRVGKDEASTGGMGDSLFSKLDFTARDSVADCLEETLKGLEALTNENECLKNRLESSKEQLEMSNAQLKTANMENGQIRAILNKTFDSKQAKEFIAKVQKLGKIPKDMETAIIDMYHTCEVFKAENTKLKVLIEMLSQRCTLQDIPIEPETSTDTKCLQMMVNTLRKEVALLRKYEDAKLTSLMNSNTSHVSDKYIASLDAVRKQRNILRQKCNRLKQIKKNFGELQSKAQELTQFADCLNCDLETQTHRIWEMDQNAEAREEGFKRELDYCKRNERLMQHQITCLQGENQRLSCELDKAETMVNSLEHEVQYQDRRCQEMMMKPKKFQRNGYRFCKCNRRIPNAPAIEEQHQDNPMSKSELEDAFSEQI